jgi:hypothetical protein
MALKLEITRTYFSHNKICLSKESSFAGIKIYNNFPIQIKLLLSDFNQFKKALNIFLQLHSFYTLAEYLNYNTD